MHSIPVTLPIADARSHLGKLVMGLKDHQTIVLTKRGRSKAVLVDVEHWNDLVGKIESLSTAMAKPSPITYWGNHLSGLGKELWENQNTEEYINTLRNQWQNPR